MNTRPTILALTRVAPQAMDAFASRHARFHAPLLRAMPGVTRVCRVQGNLGLREQTVLGRELDQAQALPQPFFGIREQIYRAFQGADPRLAAFPTVSSLERHIEVNDLDRDSFPALRSVDRLTRRLRARMRRVNPRLDALYERFYAR